jgi:hypothetical protein
MISLEVAAKVAQAFHQSAAPSPNALALYYDHSLSAEAAARLKVWDEQPEAPRALVDLRRLLLPGLLMVEQRFLDIPRQWPSIYRRSRGTFNPERVVEMRYTGLAQLRSPGSPTIFDNAVGERFVYNIPRNDLALATTLASDLARSSAAGTLDKAGFEIIAALAHSLAEAFRISEEILHANVLNTGTVYNPGVMGDVVPLFSNAHPIDTGHYSNLMDAPLSMASLEQAIELMAAMPDQAGNPKKATPKILVVPIALQFKAVRLMHQIADEVGEERRGRYPSEYAVLDYLSSPDAWFVKTSIHGLASMEWAPFRLDLKIEGDGLVLEGAQSYTAGYYNPRACVGSFPTPAALDAAREPIAHLVRQHQ